MKRSFGKSLTGFAAACALAAAGMQIAGFPAFAQSPAQVTYYPGYSELVQLADSSALVIRAQILKQVPLGPEQSPGLKPGWVRLYVEASTQALIAGSSGIGESLRYLVDVPLDAKGKPPKLKKQVVLLFADPVPGNPADIQLIYPDAQYTDDPDFEEQIREVLVQLHDPAAPPQITGVREAMSVKGNLAGESESQFFLSTDTGEPVSLLVERRPNMAPQWGVSWTDIVDQSAKPPQHGTLAWYRLACSLPAQLPQEAIISRDPGDRARTAQDYALVLDQLGPCIRHEY